MPEVIEAAFMRLSHSIQFRCPNSESLMGEASDGSGLVSQAGQFYPYSVGTRIPIFAEAPADSSEYSITNAAEVHDNALRWLFATFGTTEDHLRANLIGRLGLVPGQSLLVTGAGAGNDLPYIAERMRGHGTIHAQDIASQMLLAVNGGRIPGQCSGAKAGHFVRGVMPCTQAPDRGPGCKAAPAKRVRVV